MKILLIRFSSIGDIVLTSPIIRCLKQQLDQCEIHYLTKQNFTFILEANPYIDKIHSFEQQLSPVIEVLKKESFDIVIDLHKNLRSSSVCKALKTKVYRFDKLNIQKWLYVNFKIDTLPDKSIVDRYFEAIEPLGVKNDGQGLDYFIPEKDITQHKDIPMSHWAGYVAFVVGGSYFTKKLPIAKWIEIAQQCPMPIILLGGEEDRAFAAEVAVLDPIKIYNSCGKFNFNESADLVKNAKAVFSNDTGLMHVAAAFKKPIVSIWGNTSPKFGMFPYYGFNNLAKQVAQQHYILEKNNLSCRPCSKLGYAKCPKGHFKCMNNLDTSSLDIFINKYIKVSNLRN